MNTQAVPRVLELNSVLHEKSRLAIVSVLAAAGEFTFRDLRDAVGMTDGNLSVHLRVLEGAGYVDVETCFVGRKPQTRIRLSAQGRLAFADYVSQLEAIVKGVRGA